MARIVVIGAGLGGMAAAYELREVLGKQHPISVVGLGDRFSFTPSNPWLAVAAQAGPAGADRHHSIHHTTLKEPP